MRRNGAKESSIWTLGFHTETFQTTKDFRWSFRTEKDQSCFSFEALRTLFLKLCLYVIKERP